MSQPNKTNNGQQSTKPEAQNEHNETSLAVVSINALIKQLRLEGLTCKVDASPDGLQLVIAGLGLASNGSGKQRIVKVDASQTQEPA